MSSKGQTERRSFERLSRCDQIRVKEYSYPEQGDYQPARFIDISGGGLLIEINRYISPKTTLKIEMNFTGWQRYTSSFLKHFGFAATKPLVVLAEVVRCSSVVTGSRYQIAVVFTGIDESHREALIRFIRAEILSNR